MSYTSTSEVSISIAIFAFVILERCNDTIFSSSTQEECGCAYAEKELAVTVGRRDVPSGLVHLKRTFAKTKYIKFRYLLT